MRPELQGMLGVAVGGGVPDIRLSAPGTQAVRPWGPGGTRDPSGSCLELRKLKAQVVNSLSEVTPRSPRWSGQDQVSGGLGAGLSSLDHSGWLTLVLSLGETHLAPA